MSRKNNNNQYDILDKILSESQSGRGDVVWVADPRHPDGGYYTPASDSASTSTEPLSWDELRKSVDDLERFLRS